VSGNGRPQQSRPRVGGEIEPLRLATYLAPNIRPVYQAVAEYLSQRLDLPVQLGEGRSLDAFAAGDLDAGFVCGLPYVQLARLDPPPVEPLAAPVLQGERYKGRPVYFSDVIVHRDSPYRSFADLRGCTWAYNDPDSHSGYNVTRYRLVRMGETAGFFGRVVEAGYHQRSIRLVAAGPDAPDVERVDASAIDSQVLAVELREHPELAAELRVIDVLGPSSIQPVVAARRLPDRLKADLRAALLAMGDDPGFRPRLAFGLVDRFVAVDDAAYDDIRGMLAAAEEAGFLALR
jgi:phosphonate transport system substrate-binding protein